MNTWNFFAAEVKRKFTKPWSNPSFLGYFLVCVIIGGGAGVYISIYEYACTLESYRITLSVGTYYAAIMAAAFADINMSNKIESKSAFFIYSLLACIIGAILLLITYLLANSNHIFGAFVTSSVGCLLALSMWIIANSDNKHFETESYGENIRDNSNNKHGNNWNDHE